MRRDSWLHRATAVTLLVLSMVVALLLPIADAHAERVMATAASHVEEPGSTSCTPAHDELMCQLCRGLRLLAVPSGHGAPASDAAAPSGPPHFDVIASLAMALQGGCSPRGPPAA
jgi:hypothetical protein